MSTTQAAQPTLDAAEAFAIEGRSIDFIPLNERRGHAKDLFTLWFGANAMAVTLVTGAIVGSFGVGLVWTGLAIVIGAVIGTAIMAYHSAQGPQLGLPQMIQSRAQFGFYGANIPLIIVIAMYLGFYAGGAVIAAQALKQLMGLGIGTSVAILTVLSLILVVFGYKMMHVLAKFITPLYIVVFALLTYSLWKNWDVFPTVSAVPVTTFKLTQFMMVVSIVTAYYITYGPYVADYSRYLPAETSTKSAFWYTYAGTISSAIWIMVLGAAIQAAFGKDDAVVGAANVARSTGPWLEVLTLLTLVVGLINIGALNVYGAMMSTLTIVTTFSKNPRGAGSQRIVVAILVAAIGGAIAGLASADFVQAYENFIFLLVTFLIPWSAVNLVDYYWIRRGRYVAADLYTPKSQYGGFNLAGLSSYVVGCLAQVPFIAQEIYTGPIAAKLGFDVAWIVGMIVPGAMYYFLVRKNVTTVS